MQCHHVRRGSPRYQFVALAVVLSSASACSGDDTNTSGGPSSSGGTAGAGGVAAGSGGASSGGSRSGGASSGGAGTGGSSSGGAGTGGANLGGTGGTSGSGGAGTGGTNPGGAGGRSAGGDAGPVVLPWDASIYGAIPEGAVYIFADPYVTTAGAPARVTAVQNAANPGSRDMTFAAGQQPLWHPGGGSSGHSYAEFDGTNDVGIATGFAFSQQAGTNEVAMQVVGRFRTVAELTQATGVFASATGNTSYHFRTFQIWSSGNLDYYRTNGLPVGFPHNIEYLTPEASNDVDWQLHEGYAKATGIIAFRNGVQFGTAGGDGLITDGANPIDEIRIGGDDRPGDHAPIDVHEVVITEGRELTQLAAYRHARVAPLYGITIQ